jgi:hypothetical protein
MRKFRFVLFLLAIVFFAKKTAISFDEHAILDARFVHFGRCPNLCDLFKHSFKRRKIKGFYVSTCIIPNQLLHSPAEGY